jgi:hypothetical protein
MHSTEEMISPQVPGSWMAASFAFAFLVGVSLSIPLLNGMTLAPTGYDHVVSDAQSHGQSFVEKTETGTCQYCAVSKEGVPAETSPSDVDPLVAFRESAGVEV